MNPGGRSRDGEGDEPWRGGRSRDLDSRVGDLEVSVGVIKSDMQHIVRAVDRIAKAVEELGNERRAVGDGLRADIDALRQSLGREIHDLGTRIESFEDDRKFKRKMFGYVAAISAFATTAWSLFGEHIAALFRRGGP